MSNEDIKLGYAVTTSSSTRGYLGAVLTTDYKGFPLEFQYTDPILPTKLQQVLYGENLEKYLKADVILESLLNVVSDDLDLLMVQDEDLLRYKHKSLKIIRVSSTKATPLSNEGDISKVKNNEILLQTSIAASPVRIQFQHDFDEENEDCIQILGLLNEVGNFIDASEPLNRVYKSLELLNKE